MTLQARSSYLPLFLYTGLLGILAALGTSHLYVFLSRVINHTADWHEAFTGVVFAFLWCLVFSLIWPTARKAVGWGRWLPSGILGFMAGFQFLCAFWLISEPSQPPGEYYFAVLGGVNLISALVLWPRKA